MTLGEPTCPVYEEGPGIVQHLDGGSGWLLCALPSHKPVVVAEPVWDALREAGSGAIGGDALTAVGFPVLAEPSAVPGRLIGADATCVTLADGTWGPGRLVRGGSDAAYEPGDVALDDARMLLSMDEVLQLLTAAWQLAADVLPSFIEGWDTARPAGPPVVELYLAADRGREHGTSDLRDMVDFSPFGHSDRRQIPEMSIAITGPLHLSATDRQLWARRALAHMGQAHGFTDASAGW